jgi:cytoskeletal protein CcmA (bactofilin family)
MSIAKIKSRLGAVNSNSVQKKFGAITSSLKSTPTIIARDLTIEGQLKSTGIVEIEGIVKGTVNGNSVILREEGFVEGLVYAEFLNIRGRFEGTIKAKNITVSSKAKIIGDIEYDSLAVEDGASIDGQFKKNQSNNDL